jgi:ABC-2 type transport system ATP-binding protein
MGMALHYYFCEFVWPTNFSWVWKGEGLMIKVVNLKKKYGKYEVLKGINFEIKKGLVYGFLGQNGAGKSTTMNILTGLIGHDGGEIYIDGLDFLKNKEMLQKKIGYLTENPVFYNYMNACEYLSFIGDVSCYPKEKIKSRVSELLDITELTAASKRRIGGYSRGMKQRLGLAVAIFNHPQILFLDEPASALDPQGRLDMLEMIESFKNQGITVFLSTHILNDVERVCDEVSILDNGQIILSKNLEELKRDYTQPIFDIEFEKECSSFNKRLEGFPWILKSVCDKKRISIYAKDMKKAKSELIKEIASEGNPVLSYQIRTSTLEDIFLRLVNKDENI